MDNNSNDLDWVREKLGIQEFVSVETIRSAEENAVTRVETDKGIFILKQGPNLEGEKDLLIWLDSKLPVPKVIAWQDGNEQDNLLMTYIEGEDLARFSEKISGEELVSLLAETLHLIHSIDISDCPFGKKNNNSVFIHGDACLPNFIFDESGLKGIIDLGRSGIGKEEDDLAAAIWSLDFNFGPELGAAFLRSYGFASPTNDDAERLKLKYENNWAERFEGNRENSC